MFFILMLILILTLELIFILCRLQSWIFDFAQPLNCRIVSPSLSLGNEARDTR